MASTQKSTASDGAVSIRQRESNMELFRCVAMFLIIAVHANFFSLTSPTYEEIHQTPLPSFTRYFLEAICIGGANMFVLISGWFGIRPKLKGFVKLIFQILFCVTLVYLAICASGLCPFSVKQLAKTLAFGDSMWFVKAYVGLYLLSPILNAFAEKVSRRQFEVFLVSYYTFELLYGWLIDFSANFKGGYSTDSFIFLYMLVRYIRLHREDDVVRTSRKVYLAIFAAVALVHGSLAFVLNYFAVPMLGPILYDYTSPTTIIMSLALLLYFSRLKIKSRFINWVAASSFSVYLLHNCLEFTVTHFKAAVQHIYASHSGMVCLLALLGFCIAVYVVTTLIDQVRIVCWNVLSKFLFGRQAR